MTAAAEYTPSLAAGRVPEFRYGVVMLIALALVMFEIVAPDADWARAVLVALAGGALSVAVAPVAGEGFDPHSTCAHRGRSSGSW